MTTKKCNSISIIVDTNFFEECKKPHEIDWQSLEGSYDEITIIVTRPVQRELDNHKKGDRNRIRKRAIEATSLLRKIIKNKNAPLVIIESAPRVVLELQPLLKADPELSTKLNYLKPDDEIIGCLSSYIRENPDKSALFLSHDTGPIGTAQTLNLPCDFLPDTWLLPPQMTDADKKLSKLENENQALKSQEPLIEIYCIDEDNQKLDKFIAEKTDFKQLDSADRCKTLDKLRLAVPRITQFEKPEPKNKTYLNPIFLGQKWQHPSEEEISKYEEKYDNWLDQCDSALETLHTYLQQRNSSTIIRFTLNNSGTRAATDTLIRFETKGALEFRLPFDPERLDIDAPGINDEFEFPEPPKAPESKWAPSKIHHGLLLSALQQNRLFPDFARISAMPNLTSHIPKPRQDDQFYWKPTQPDDFVEKVELTCKLWRHGQPDEFFEYEINSSNNKELSEGVIECGVHATNLTIPKILITPVKITNTKRTPMEEAAKAVKRLTIKPEKTFPFE